ncbi:MAG: uncharacterized protein A8A55_3350, partial [Amphiamblys sp. WSBS2006]
MQSPIGEKCRVGIREEANGMISLAEEMSIDLKDEAIGLFFLIQKPENTAFGRLVLDTKKPANIAEILKQKTASIWLGRIKSIKLRYDAVDALPKLGVAVGNALDMLVLDFGEDQECPEIARHQHLVWNDQEYQDEIQRSHRHPQAPNPQRKRTGELECRFPGNI